MRATITALSLLAVGAGLGWLASQYQPSGTAQAQEKAASAPPLLQQINNGNWLDEAEAKALVDELYYQRAVHTYMTMLPALNTIGMDVGSAVDFTYKLPFKFTGTIEKVTTDLK